jgi:CDI immunity proteins
VRIGEIDRSLASRPKGDTSVAIRAHSLIDRQLEDLTPGEIAFCLRQGIATTAVGTRAIDVLAAEPLLEAEHYPGDLLSAAIHAETNGWLTTDQRSELRDICTSVVARVEQLARDVVPLAEEFIRRHDAT